MEKEERLKKEIEELKHSINQGLQFQQLGFENTFFLMVTESILSDKEKELEQLKNI